MLRKSRGEGYSLSISLTEAERSKVALYLAVKGEKAMDDIKKVVLANLKLSANEAKVLNELVN